MLTNDARIQQYIYLPPGSDKSWWRHQMEAFSALLAFWSQNSPVTGEFPSQRPVTRSFDVFLWYAAWINNWVNNREVGDLRQPRAHYDVTVMQSSYDKLRRAMTRSHRCASLLLRIHFNTQAYIFPLWNLSNVFYPCTIETHVVIFW